MGEVPGREAELEGNGLLLAGTRVESDEDERRGGRKNPSEESVEAEMISVDYSEDDPSSASGTVTTTFGDPLNRDTWHHEGKKAQRWPQARLDLRARPGVSQRWE